MIWKWKAATLHEPKASMHVHTQFLVLAWAMHPHMPALLCSVQTENIECLALTHTFSKRWPGHKPYHIRAKHERGNRQCSHRILISILSALVLQFDLIFTTLDALCCIKLRPSHDYANSDQSTSPRVLEHFNVTDKWGKSWSNIICVWKQFKENVEWCCASPTQSVWWTWNDNHLSTSKTAPPIIQLKLCLYPQRKQSRCCVTLVCRGICVLCFSQKTFMAGTDRMCLSSQGLFV